jgi:hypothetical protein
LHRGWDKKKQGGWEKNEERTLNVLDDDARLQEDNVLQEVPLVDQGRHQSALKVHGAHTEARGSHVRVVERLVVALQVRKEETPYLPHCRVKVPGGSAVRSSSLIGIVPSKISTCIKQLKGLEGHEEGGCFLHKKGGWSVDKKRRDGPRYSPALPLTA